MTTHGIADSTWIKEKVLNQVARLGFEWKQFCDFYSPEMIRSLQNEEPPSLAEFLSLAHDCIIDRIALRLIKLADQKGDLSFWKLTMLPEFQSSSQCADLERRLKKLCSEIIGSLKLYRDKLIAHNDSDFFRGTIKAATIDRSHFLDWINRTVAWMDEVDRIFGGTGGLQDLIDQDLAGEAASSSVCNYGELLKLRDRVGVGKITMHEFGMKCLELLR